MQSFTFIVVAALIGTCLSSPAQTDVMSSFSSLTGHRTDYGNANFYIDMVLFNINRQLPDIIPLPDIGGPFNLKNCVMFGLEDKIKRDGDATLAVAGSSARFIMDLRMLNVGFSCDWRYVLMSGSASGKTAKVSLASGLAWILEHDQHPYLTEFRVKTLEPITTDVSGVVGFNWLVEDIADAIIAGLEEAITEVVEHQLKNQIQKILDTMVIP